jgi:hypothetical protein
MQRGKSEAWVEFPIRFAMVTIFASVTVSFEIMQRLQYF